MAMGVTLVLLAGAVVAATVVVWVRRRGGEESYLVFRCPDCGQKVRYLATRAGRNGMCPRCRRTLLLPVDPGRLSEKAQAKPAERAQVGRVLRHPARPSGRGASPDWR